jgi:hypothetical protein
MRIDLTAAEWEVLVAAQECIQRGQAVIALVHQALGQSPFEYWILERFGCKGVPLRQEYEQHGVTLNGQWRWFFHGLEIDLQRLQDRRTLRVDFGPGGRLDVFTVSGIQSHIEGGWRSFPELSMIEQTNCYHGIAHVCACLREKALVEYCDPEAHELFERFTRPGDEVNELVIDIPPELLPEDLTRILLRDAMVIAPDGHEQIERRRMLPAPARKCVS